MKIAVVGDIHCGAGYSLGKTDPETQLNSRLLDFIKTFDSTIDTFVNKGVTVVVLTGDIYDTRHPTPTQLNMFSKSLQRAVLKGIKIFMVIGNHDQQRTVSTTTVDIYNALQLDNIISFPKMSVHTIKDGEKNVNLVMMPYRDRKMISDSQNNETAVKEIKKELDHLTNKLVGPKIAVGHFMIGKTITGETSETFSISELVLPLDMFSNFDAVVMGHVHKHEIISKRPLIMYSGSMDHISFGEKDHTKVSIILDTDDISKTEIIDSDVRSMFEMSFDYSTEDKYYKSQITNKILEDIIKFCSTNNIEESIVRLIVKIKENDRCYIDQERLRRAIIEKKVNFLAPLQISSVNIRKLRNKEITESVDSKKAMTAFINNLKEPETIKKKLLKSATLIIEEVEGK